MPIVIPPKKPLPLALYCLSLYILISVAWDLVLHLPTQNSKGLVILMFAIVGYYYGKFHKLLPLKAALLTCLYFTIPVMALRLLPVLNGIRDIPRNELLPFLALTAGIFALLGGIQLVFNAFILSFLSKYGAKTGK